MDKNIYQENGYGNRNDYLVALSEDYDVPLDVVLSLTDLLGESEDFDGLIEILLDYEDFRSYEEE
jgi:hypothetical protein